MKSAPDLQPLFARLREAGYHREALRRRLGANYPEDVGLVNYPVAVESARASGDDLDLLLRLFWLECEEPVARVKRALPGELLQTLLEMRMLRRRPAGTIESRLRVEPADDLLLAADRRFRGWDRGALRLPTDEPVYPPSADSLLLAEIFGVPEGARVLDLCTGSGVLALWAARYARVEAVDLAQRAVALAGVNALANGLPGIRFRRGNLYAPLRGSTYDAIIANPPFVPSPHRDGPSYHAGGPTGDRVLRRVIAGWERHLAPGGRGFAVSHCALRRGETIESVAGDWLRGFRGRGLVLILERGRPIDLAAAQSAFALETGRVAYLREVGVWRDYLKRNRVESVVAFLLVGERGEKQGVEVVDATPRVLPLPFHRPPGELVREWLARPA